MINPLKDADILSSKEFDNIIKNCHDALSNHTSIIALVTGKVRGKDRYAYLLVNTTKYISLKIDEGKQGLNLKKYGTIIAHGEGKKPPSNVTEQIQSDYQGISFEEDIMPLLERLTAKNQ